LDDKAYIMKLWRSRIVTYMALLAMTGSAGYAADASRPLTVFAAVSLTDALTEASGAYTSKTGVAVRHSFASSAALARQLEAGARADIFFSADVEWMDYLQARGLIDAGARKNILSNRLVLIAPADSGIELRIAPNFPLRAALGRGRLAMGDPDSVPAGRYARTALASFGVWNDIANRVVRADNVRVALAYVARGEAPLGIVYETDARIEDRVRIVDVFPSGSHPPIMYPLAVPSTAMPIAKNYAAFIASDAAKEIFGKYGFVAAE
jgi:molybdate transport system substrate-binding protein